MGKYRKSLIFLIMLHMMFFLFPGIGLASDLQRTKELEQLPMEKEKYGGAEKKNRKQKGNNSQDLSQKFDLEKSEDDLATKDRRKMRKNFFPKNITFWSDFTVKKVGESFYQPSKKIVMSGYDNGPIAFVGNDDEIAAHTLNTLSNVSLKKLKSLGVPVHENVVVQRYGVVLFIFRKVKFSASFLFPSIVAYMVRLQIILMKHH